jgi:low temperature requirement protein LtrA
MLFAMMLAGLLMSAAIPKAFETTGLTFAIAYVGMQVGRSLFTMWSFAGLRPGHHRNFQRISIWLATAGVFWIAGGFASGGARFALWALALAIEYVAPWAFFHVPGLGKSTTAEWDVNPAHMAERCGLFIIIALGESILVTGATFAKLAWTPALIGAFVCSFVGSVAMWWIYFNIGAERATKHFSGAADPGAVARLAYTYLHLPIVAGIIVTAAADEFVLAHPGGHTDVKTAVAVIGGPALYVLGNLLFKRATAGWFQLSHLVGLGLLALAAPLALVVSPLALSVVVTGVLVLVAAWEAISLRPKRS